MFSFAAKLLVVFIVANCLMIEVENKSVYGIGTRIIGDQLLMKDILKTPPFGITEDPAIHFNYAISQPITYIEILSEKDVYASIDFSYENELVHGTIRESTHGYARKPGPFEVLIQIYGLNDTVLNVNPSYILNKDQQFNGFMRPKIDQQTHETLSLMKADSAVIDNLDDNYEVDEVDDDDDIYDQGEDYGENDYGDYDDRVFNDKLNKVIELGSRQKGDYMLYETYQTSENSTETDTNHTVTFYYIDSNFITYVKFTIYDHYLANSLVNYQSPTVQFEKISPHTLKAIVTDQHTTSLFVQMQIYGYKPRDKPVAYESYLTQSQSEQQTPANVPNGDDVDAIENVVVILPLSKHRRIHVHFNAEEREQHQQHKHKQQQQQQQHHRHQEQQQQQQHGQQLPQTDGASNVSNSLMTIYNWLLLQTFATVALAVVSNQIVY